MLNNMLAPVVDERTEILQKMQNSMFVFHLTGSRVFQTAFHSESDYDFFVQSDENVKKFLSELEFIPTKSKYDDSLTTIVYTHNSGIDVQLVTNIRLKQIAQDILIANRIILVASGDKQYRKRVWEMVISAIKQGFAMQNFAK